MVYPTNSNAVSTSVTCYSRPHFGDVTYDFVTEDDGQSWRYQPTFDFIQFRVTDTANRDSHQKFARCRPGRLDLP